MENCPGMRQISLLILITCNIGKWPVIQTIIFFKKVINFGIKLIANFVEIHLKKASKSMRWFIKMILKIIQKMNKKKLSLPSFETKGIIFGSREI